MPRARRKRTHGGARPNAGRPARTDRPSDERITIRFAGAELRDMDLRLESEETRSDFVRASVLAEIQRRASRGGG